MTELGTAPPREGSARGRCAAGLDLAARRGGDRRPHPRAPVDDRVRELAAAGRAADGAAQRDLRRATAAVELVETRRAAISAGSTASDGARCGTLRHHAARCSRAPTTAPSARSSAPSSKTTSSRAGCAASSRPHRSSSASTWARSTSSSRSSLRRSVASGLQRVGRAGHQVGEISRGVLFPKHRADLLHTAVASERMLAGLIEAIAVPANPLDILAQQTVAAVALEPIDVEEWFDTVRRSAPFATLPRWPTTRRSTCSAGSTRATSSPSCVRASCGTASPARSPGDPARSGWP